MKQDNIFYSRTETENEVIIKWKPYTTYSTFLCLLAMPLISILTSASPMSTPLTIVGIFILMMVNSVITIKATKQVTAEIRMAQQKGNCRLEGNKYSFSNPLVIYIDKSQQD